MASNSSPHATPNYMALYPAFSLWRFTSVSRLHAPSSSRKICILQYLPFSTLHTSYLSRTV